MKIARYILPALLSVAVFCSCDTVMEWIHDDEVVARYGRKVLYLSQLEKYIPDGISSEDSTNLALQYINTWANELIFADVALSHLSKAELDVTEELEDYRRSLIKYRYEQRYVNDRLDTLVTREEIEEYYNLHKDLFVLQVPIVKARFLDIMRESPNRDVIRLKMSSDDYEDLQMADSLSYSSALKYIDNSENWEDAVSFARKFGIDYGTLLSNLGRDGYVEIDEGRGDVKIGFVQEMRKAGTLAPVDYCEERIKDIILSNRKRELLTTLERDLLNDALDSKKLDLK